ncbi:hypothetical protein BC628DRAFT_428981 [Trametes gibbosa]|nr:hypothetical protein BC628DRAFT_428981 [Trametes gibbosa]
MASLLPILLDASVEPVLYKLKPTQLVPGGWILKATISLLALNIDDGILYIPKSGVPSLHYNDRFRSVRGRHRSYTYRYYKLYPKDHISLKIFVSMLFGLETLHTVVWLVTGYNYLIADPFITGSLARGHWGE